MAKIKKGKVYIYTDRNKLVPYVKLEKAEIQKSSKQLKATKRWLAANGLIPPPYSMDNLLTLHESNPVFAACVRQISEDVAGLGWTLVLKEGAKENTEELKKINNLLNRPNPEDSFRSIVKRLLIDWGSLGNSGLEIIRDASEMIVEMYYLPAHTLRVHEDLEKYCQIRNNKKVWFIKYGIEKQIAAKDGKEGEFDEAKRANELIFSKNFYQKSDYYGLPNIVSAIGDVVGLIGIRDFNLSFFQNFGIPAGIVTLDGDWEDGSEKVISEFLEKEVKGTENAHRTMVMKTPEECKFTWTPLAVDMKEASFKVYAKDLKENVLMVYSMPPERIGIRIVGKLGGNVAEEATKIYLQAMVDPLQEDLEDIINHKIIEQGLQCINYTFKFNDIDLRDLTALEDRLIKKVRSAMMTPNEARNIMGQKAYPEGDKFYIESTLVEIGGPEEEGELGQEEE